MNKEKVKYYGEMDKECIPICDAINKIPGLRTNESCCGHGKQKFRVFFRVTDMKKFPLLLYYCDPCHVGFQWNCTIHTDCAMSPVYFMLESESMGEEAYKEANEIAAKIEEELS
jgi:hypothetical protein